MAGDALSAIRYPLTSTSDAYAVSDLSDLIICLFPVKVRVVACEEWRIFFILRSHALLPGNLYALYKQRYSSSDNIIVL